MNNEHRLHAALLAERTGSRVAHVATTLAFLFFFLQTPGNVYYIVLGDFRGKSINYKIDVW